MDGWRPVGVIGVLVALAVSPAIGFGFGGAAVRADRRLLRRARRRVRGPIQAAEWGMTAALSLSHGANDAQKSMGVIAALLLAAGHEQQLAVPLWAKVACGAALTVGTAMGGWRIVRTVGRGIVRLTAVDGFASQSSSAAVILGASFAGAPVSTTHVVSSSVVGIGAGRRRWHHIRWPVVRAMAVAWVLTLPGAALLGGAAVIVWRSA
jgi:PiT family inorganic phosphate transporter